MFQSCAPWRPVLALCLCLFLAAPAAAEEIDLAAELARHSVLQLPKGPGPFPGLVMMSGCRGVSGKRPGLGRETDRPGLRLPDRRFHAAPRLFRRGLHPHPGPPAAENDRPTCGGAFAIFKSRPEIDPDRIGLLGWSHGGWTVLAAIDRDRTPLGGGFRAAAVFYPHCGWFMPERISAPLLMLVGGRDDICPPRKCLETAERLNRAGDSVQIQVFPEARHAFDHDDLPAVQPSFCAAPWATAPRRQTRPGNCSTLF